MGGYDLNNNSRISEGRATWSVADKGWIGCFWQVFGVVGRDSYGGGHGQEAAGKSGTAPEHAEERCAAVPPGTAAAAPQQQQHTTAGGVGGVGLAAKEKERRSRRPKWCVAQSAAGDWAELVQKLAC